MKDKFDYNAVALDDSINGTYIRWIEDFVINCPDISSAHDLAEELHEDQKYGREPYMYHLNGVAANALKIALEILDPSDLRTTERMRRAIMVAFLHDCVEDGKIICIDLLRRLDHIVESHKIVDDVRTLTREDGQSYVEYVRDLCKSGTVVAKIVKLADLRFNKMQNLLEINNGKKHFKHMYEKYSFAEILVRQSLYGG